MVAFIGSPHRGRTCEIVELFEQKLKELGEIDFKSVSLKDVDLKLCRGCGVCLEKGEEYCALKDDRDALLAMLREADGVIFATPVYSLQVTALMKNFLDRLAYVFHRPCFFHKAFMPIVVQGGIWCERHFKLPGRGGSLLGLQDLPGARPDRALG